LLFEKWLGNLNAKQYECMVVNGSFLANRHSIQIHNKFLKNDQMDMVVNFKDFDILIFGFQMFTHLWNLLSLGQNLNQKLLMFFIMVDDTWNPKRKTHKIHMNDGQCNFFKSMFTKHKQFEIIF